MTETTFIIYDGVHHVIWTMSLQNSHTMYYIQQLIETNSGYNEGEGVTLGSLELTHVGG